MNIFKTLLLALCLTAGFSACKKNTVNCPAATALTITGSNFVMHGWNLTMSFAYANPLLKYVASGPNGWSEEITGRQIIKTNLQLQDAGTYYIRGYNAQNCVVEEGYQIVYVTPIEHAPCQGAVSNNSGTSDFPGLSSFNYSSVTFVPDIANSFSTVTALTSAPIPANTYLALSFAGTSKPKPGKYRTVYTYQGAGLEDNVSVHFNDGTTNQLNLSAADQNVYVTIVNGKTQICFCNIAVSYTFPGPPKYISGKITLN